MGEMHPAVDRFLARTTEWHAEFVALRQIILAHGDGLSEEFKWGWPCYTLAGKNVVLMHGFKEYCALLFMKGVLMDDPAGMLVAQTDNVQSARHLRFGGLADIAAQTAVIGAYVQHAVAVEQSGAQVPMKSTADFVVCDELQEAFVEMPELEAAFASLTPGRQRGYLLYFAAAKQSKTRTARIEKYRDQIMAGQGLHD
jgi:uncharacterized protein YdeI (YjbR/CyaY-like superfamily)